MSIPADETYLEFPRVYNFPNCLLMSKNFEGREREYNEAGKRNFCIRLSEEEALVRFPTGRRDLQGNPIYGPGLREQGLNVKQCKHREDEEHPDWFVQVHLGFEQNRPNPGITMVKTDASGRPKHIPIDQDTVSIIDHSELVEANVAARASNWSRGGRSGRTLYLRNMDFTLYQDCVEERRSQMVFDGFESDVDADDEVEAV